MKGLVAFRGCRRTKHCTENEKNFLIFYKITWKFCIINTPGKASVAT